MDQLIQYETKWGISESNPHKISNGALLIDYFNTNLDISNNATISEIQAKFNDYITDLITVYNDLKKYNETKDFEVIVRMNRLLEML